MNQNFFKRLTAFGGFIFFLLFHFDGKAQNTQQAIQSKRVKECFDFNWQFHKGDIAIKRAIKDSEGRVIPTADNLVKFSIDGPGKIIGTGNGNPSNHEPDKANQRMAFNGYCLVLVQSEKTAVKFG